MVHKLYAHSQLISFSTGTSIQLVQQHEQHAACIKPVQITIKTHCLWPRALQEGWLNKNYVCSIKVTQSMSLSTSHWLTTTTVLRPFVRDYPGEPVPEETLTHPPSWSSSNLYQLLPSTTIHSNLLVQITCLAIFLHNLFPCRLWSTSWSGALHLIFHTFLHPISVFFLQHMPIPSQPVLL